MVKTINALVIVILIASMALTCFVEPADAGRKKKSSWQEEFNLHERNLVTTGRNQFFILEPGFQLVLESKNEKLAITVLDETKEVDGILTRVVEEREWKKGKLAEVSRNFFAICDKTNDIFYFGEEVDMYKREKLVSHKGAWIAGENNARPGLIMPGDPIVGMKYYQEIAPRRAMDRAEVIDLEYTRETPAGTFTKCLKTRETTPLNFFEREYKIYAPDIGLIKDGKLLLTKHGFIEMD
jgi:hypothetical protein